MRDLALAFNSAADNETVKSILNKAFFTKLYVDGGKVTEHELNEPFDTLSEAYAIYRRQTERQHRGHTYYRTSGSLALSVDLAASTGQPEPSPGRPYQIQTASSADLLTETGATSRNPMIDSLALAFAGQGSSKPVMVGTTGLEPATP